jgi:hypothetical protein
MNAAGVSQWVPIDYIESWFGVEAGVCFSEDASLTAAVQYTLDYERIDPSQPTQKVSISRTTTTATVTDYGPFGLGHGLLTGDSVVINGSGSTQLDSPAPLFGSGGVGFTITQTGKNTYTYPCVNAGPAADGGNAYVSRQRIYTHSTLTGLTSRANGTFNYPVRAIRLSVTGYSAGYCDLTVLQGSSA